MDKICWFLFNFFVVLKMVSARSFSIDYNNNTFVKDGKPFRYVSGSIHPYRVPRALWQDRLDKMWAAGLNAIQTYVFWNEHEQTPGVYEFVGQNDIFTFIKMAQNTGFLVILRAGPYVCSEHDFGALPWWLSGSISKSRRVRTIDQLYMAAVRRWLNELLPQVASLLYKNGGPIITVQIENEYGYYYACDLNYMNTLSKIFRQYLGDDVVFFTTDPSFDFALKCGTIEHVYPTVDFGTGTNVAKAFAVQRMYAPKGPLVNSEFYDGWLNLWELPRTSVATSSVLKSFYQMMDMGANVNFYMFHGGTNFGYSNGAVPPYFPEVTSYDFDAPISESGDITDKYLAIRNAISKYLTLPQVPIPVNSTKKAYGKIQMAYHSSLVDAIIQNTDRCLTTPNPLTFEILGQGYGFIVYYTTLSDPNVHKKVLSIPGVRDRAYIQIGNVSIGVLQRLNSQNITINLQNNTNTTLYIIVENMGRLNFAPDLNDGKGIISSVTLDGVELTKWTQCLTNDLVPNFQTKRNKVLFTDENGDIHAAKEMNYDTERLTQVDYKVPAVYIGHFDAPNGVYDSFLKMDQFTKGIALIGSRDTFTNLGRYWPHAGPQVTLYVPGVFTSPSFSNTIILVEFENALCSDPSQCYVELIDYPILNRYKADG